MSGLMRGLEETYVCAYLTQILDEHWVSASAGSIQLTAYVHNIALLYSVKEDDCDTKILPVIYSQIGDDLCITSLQQ